MAADGLVAISPVVAVDPQQSQMLNPREYLDESWDPNADWNRQDVGPPPQQWGKPRFFLRKLREG